MIRDFLGKVLVKDATAEPGDSVVAICQKALWETFQPELLAVMESTTERDDGEEHSTPGAGLLGQAREEIGMGGPLQTPPKKGSFKAIEAIDTATSSTDWQSRKVNRAEVLTGLARSLLATAQCELLSRFVTHALALPKIYPLTSAHVPSLESLRDWLKKNVKRPCDGLTRWVAACREQLESLTASEPRRVLADFRREAPITCKCSECAELKRFLQDPRIG